MVEQANARSSTLSGDAAVAAVIRQVDEIYATKGKQVVHVDLHQSRPGRAELAALLLGPTGNLRAPTLRKGRTLIVGFDEATYARLLR